MSRADEQAFPIQASALAGTLDAQPGLTIREHYAAMAMQAIISNPLFSEMIVKQRIPHDEVPEYVALGAVEHADALIAALAKSV